VKKNARRISRIEEGRREGERRIDLWHIPSAKVFATGEKRIYSLWRKIPPIHGKFARKRGPQGTPSLDKGKASLRRGKERHLLDGDFTKKGKKKSGEPITKGEARGENRGGGFSFQRMKIQSSMRTSLRSA